MKKKGDGSVLLAILILLVILAIAGYILYQNMPGEGVNLNVNLGEGELNTANLSSNVKQFYPNMRFDTNQLTYKIDDSCSEEKKTRMLEAFNTVTEKIGIVSFSSVSMNPYIEISCSDVSKPAPDKDYYIAGEGGATDVVQTNKYNIIQHGIVFLHGTIHSGSECSWANVELHELLHVFGFDHSDDENSLMYPYLLSCNQKLDESIIWDLKILYSQEALPDLYFENANALKKGRYLDFNVTVRNSGLITAENIVLKAYDNNKEVGNFELGEIKPGAGTNLVISNLKLLSRSSEKIEIKIDPVNLIKEIDENNNKLELMASG